MPKQPQPEIQLALQGHPLMIEGYVTDPNAPEVKKLHDRVMEVIKLVPRFDFIKPEDFGVAICAKNKYSKVPEDPSKLQHSIAECLPIRDVVRSLAETMGLRLPPYFIIFRPPFFKDNPEEQDVTIVHELTHIKRKETDDGVVVGKGTVPHSGFGDENSRIIREHYLQVRLDTPPESVSTETPE